MRFDLTTLQAIFKVAEFSGLVTSKSQVHKRRVVAHVHNARGLCLHFACVFAAAAADLLISIIFFQCEENWLADIAGFAELKLIDLLVSVRETLVCTFLFFSFEDRFGI